MSDPPTFKYGCHTNKYCKLGYFGYSLFWGLFGKIKHAKIKQTPKIKTPLLTVMNQYTSTNSLCSTTEIRFFFNKWVINEMRTSSDYEGAKTKQISLRKCQNYTHQN